MSVETDALEIVKVCSETIPITAWKLKKLDLLYYLGPDWTANRFDACLKYWEITFSRFNVLAWESGGKLVPRMMVPAAQKRVRRDLYNIFVEKFGQVNALHLEPREVAQAIGLKNVDRVGDYWQRLHGESLNKSRQDALDRTEPAPRAWPELDLPNRAKGVTEELRCSRCGTVGPGYYGPGEKWLCRVRCVRIGDRKNFYYSDVGVSDSGVMVRGKKS